MLRINTVDQRIGEALQERRAAIGESIETFAAKLGVIPELLEKWEGGFARIPSDTLQEASLLLKVKVSCFFSSARRVDDFVPDGVTTSSKVELSEMIRLVLDFKGIQDVELRAAVLSFAESLAKINRSDTNIRVSDLPSMQI